MVTASASRRPRADEISEALADRRYIERHYLPELRDRLLGPHSTQLIGVTRFYRWLDPPVVVDFEPYPLDGKFWVDEKRRFLAERGIAYVPVFLGERITKEQFVQRVRQERRVLGQLRCEAGENRALAQGTREVPGGISEESLELDRKALRLLREEIRVNTFLRGASRAKRLAAIRRTLAASGLPARHAR